MAGFSVKLIRLNRYLLTSFSVSQKLIKRDCFLAECLGVIFNFWGQVHEEIYPIVWH